MIRKLELIEHVPRVPWQYHPWPCLFLEASILWILISCYSCTNVFVLFWDPWSQMTLEAWSSSMRNRLHKVLGGRVRCRRGWYICTICSFPGYCLGLRTKHKVFFPCLTLFCPIYWSYFRLNVEICRFLCWQTTDDRQSDCFTPCCACVHAG